MDNGFLQNDQLSFNVQPRPDPIAPIPPQDSAQLPLTTPTPISPQGTQDLSTNAPIVSDELAEVSTCPEFS